MHPLRSTGVVGTARRKGDAGNWGDPPKHEGRALDAVSDGDAGGSSDRVIVPAMPGNVGGGKGPDFWCACDEAEDR